MLDLPTRECNQWILRVKHGSGLHRGSKSKRLDPVGADLDPRWIDLDPHLDPIQLDQGVVKGSAQTVSRAAH